MRTYFQTGFKRKEALKRVKNEGKYLAVIDNEVKELAASILYDHDDISRGSYNFVQLYYMGVPQQFEVLDLPLHPPHHVHVGNLFSVDDFHCNFMASYGMHRHCKGLALSIGKAYT